MHVTMSFRKTVSSVLSTLSFSDQPRKLKLSWDGRYLKIIPFLISLLISSKFFESRQMKASLRSVTQFSTNEINRYDQNSITEHTNGSNVMISTTNPRGGNNRSTPGFIVEKLGNRTVAGTEKENETSIMDTYVPNQVHHNPLVWLLSFPNSGTTYTLHLIQDITNTSTATNYGKEQIGTTTSIPINPNEPNGPYYRYAERRAPHSTTTKESNHTKNTPYVLTKSHCEPNQVIIAKEEFAASCSSGDRQVNRKVQHHITYDYRKVKVRKIIHLIRNPFDNMVARMHYEKKKWMKYSTKKDKKKLKLFTNSIKGFGLWCMYKDKKAEEHHVLNYILQKFQSNQQQNDDISRNISSEETRKNFTSWNDMYDQNGTIPFCVTEFYRYLQWHNHVVELTTKKKSTNKFIKQHNGTIESEEAIPENVQENDDDSKFFEDFPVMYLYYENYTAMSLPVITPPKLESKGDANLEQSANKTRLTEARKIAKDIVSNTSILTKILQFLEFDIDIDVKGLPTPFIQGKSYYETHFTEDERRLLSGFAKNYLSPRAWKLLEHYFSDTLPVVESQQLSNLR